MTQVATALTLRKAMPAEIPGLEALIAGSARTLSRVYYDANQIEAAIANVFGVGSELVADGSYCVAEWEGALVGCGGWSRRATLFGSDRFTRRSSALLVTATDAARIAPSSSRKIGRDVASAGRCWKLARPPQPTPALAALS